MWQSLQSKIDDERLYDQLFRQIYQAGHSIVWRDAVSNFYNNLSGIPDEAKRVGNHSYCIEAESMELDGFVPYVVSPFETPSKYTVIVTASNTTNGTAQTTITCPSGTYDVAVNYFDQFRGASHFVVSINDETIGEWTSNLKPWIGNSEGPRVLGHTIGLH